MSPHISHYYLHNARTGLKENDLRKSTIDIGTALEIALTEKCESILKQKNDQKFINEILKKVGSDCSRIEKGKKRDGQRFARFVIRTKTAPEILPQKTVIEIKHHV